jgi:hypothetical protein
VLPEELLGHIPELAIGPICESHPEVGIQEEDAVVNRVEHRPELA